MLFLFTFEGCLKSVPRCTCGDMFGKKSRPMTSKSLNKPGLKRATHWSEAVEECYRFQTAGYRDLKEYCHVQGLLSLSYRLTQLIRTSLGTSLHNFDISAF